MIRHLLYFDIIFIVLDIWAFFLCCWVFDWSRVWWDLTTCLPMDCYEGYFKVITNIDVLEASRWTDDSWCLLDALRWAPWSARLWFDFMLFRSTMMGSRCGHTPTREGGTTIWIRSDHSSTDYGFDVIIWRYWRQVDALLWLSCSSGADLSCAWTMCIRLHGVVLHDFSSVHDTRTSCWSALTSTYDTGWHICGARYPWGPSGTNSSTNTCPFWCGVA